MEKYYKEILLDFSGGATPQRITAKQGDKKSRFIKISPILDNQQLTIDEGCTVDLRCVKPDKSTVKTKGIKESDGKISFELPEQALTVAGDVQADIAIIGNNGEIFSSSNFIIEVRNSPTESGEYIPSEDYFKRESDIDMNNHQIKNLSSPVNNGDAATKEYVDGKVVTVDSELSAESENPVQNRAIAKAIENSKPMLITFNNSDFDNSDSQQLPIGISFKLNQSRIMLIATFDVSRLNFRISDGSDYSIYKVLIEGEPFDLSMLDEYIKSMETLESDYGEGWIVEGSQYAYMHEYSFGNVDNANTVFAELSEMGLNGFQLLVNQYNQITAKEV